MTVMAPWPLKVVIDRVLSHRHLRLPVLRDWLNNPALDPAFAFAGVLSVQGLVAAAGRATSLR